MDESGFGTCAYPGCDNDSVFILSEGGGRQTTQASRYCISHLSTERVTEDTSAAANGCAIVLAVIGAAAMVGLIV